MPNYDVVAISVPIWFNKWGHHDHNGMMYLLRQNLQTVEHYKQYLKNTKLTDAQRIAHPAYELIRPLVLRACKGETVVIKFENLLTHSEHKQVGIHLVGDGYDVATSDGAAVGANPSTLHTRGTSAITYTWHCQHEGVFVFHDAGNLSGMEDGTNVHGLFGALVVEPEGTRFRDPVTGKEVADGLYVDVIPAGTGNGDSAQTRWLAPPVKYPEDVPDGSVGKAFREYVIFFHDEVEFLSSHSTHTPDICQHQPDICGNPPPPEHATHPIMTISYRAEPMVARQQELWRLISGGRLKAPVVHEEQHHSSWMFGDPATPILKAYIGDPVRIRLVHAGVKETHVFHLHVYSWHHDALNRDSPIIDAISISPQTGHTIMPLWGAGNRQGATGDVIWHCHLYPHFHEGMWGLFRTFDALNDGNTSFVYPDGTPIEALLPLPDREPPPARTALDPGFPNFIPGTYGQRAPLPPWNDGSSIPEGLDYRPPTRSELDRLGWASREQTRLGWTHLNTTPEPAWMFNAFALPKDMGTPTGAGAASDVTVADNQPILHLSVETQRLLYNQHGWHDPAGHLFRPVESPRVKSQVAPPYVRDKRGRHDFHHFCGSASGAGNHVVSTPSDEHTSCALAFDYAQVGEKPLFFRANHGDIVRLELENRLPRAFCISPFDEALPPCEKYSVVVGPYDGYHNTDRYWKADRTPPMPCGQHVHLVKFDPLVADGASTGWNYLSGPRAPYWDEQENIWRYLRMRYIWWADEEFGVVFTHDHLFANFRQKRGLFGAMIVEPHGSTWRSPDAPQLSARFGDEAVICKTNGDSFREICIGLGDFVPLYNRDMLPLNEPPIPGGHSDHGVVGINYRSAPIRERTIRAHDPASRLGDPRRQDPAYCFSSHVWGDPDTPIFRSHPGDPIRIRLIQGSHEEQHSFQIHGMKWRRFLNDTTSPMLNQQTIGISEQFSFHVDHYYGEGDYLYKFGTSDDLWMGAWGIIRVSGKFPSVSVSPSVNPAPVFNPSTARKFRVIAEPREIVYCDQPSLSDPYGLTYRLDGPNHHQRPHSTEWEPLVLRCNKGEWVEIELVNQLPHHSKPEPNAPMVPVEIPDRPVSRRVSMHADLLWYDVKKADGCNVGFNPEQTAGVNPPVVYCWYADSEGAVLLQDMADFRNHRHHGLIGALIVEPRGATWPAGTGIQSTITEADGTDFDEIVILIQDGLRFFHFGNLSLPMADPPADPGDIGPDPSDQGQRAFNYRAQPIGKPNWMSLPAPATRVFHIGAANKVRLHLLTAADKPRNHSFTVHGMTWKEWPSTGSATRVAGVTNLSSGSVVTLELDAPAGGRGKGDYAYRSGVLRWALPQGLWGILRVP